MKSLGLSPDEIQDLIMSVGTHQSNRRLSPSEVAHLIGKAQAAGATMRQVGDRLRLDPSMLVRFLRLLSLPRDVRELVDWGSGGSRLGMTGASVIARLREEADQRELARAAVEHKLTASEITQVAQTLERSGRSVSECVESALQLRPTIERRFLYIGAVTSVEVSQELCNRSQRDRDSLLHSVILARAPQGGLWDMRLGPSSFSLVGPKSLSGWILSLPQNFELEVNSWLGLCLKA